MDRETTASNALDNLFYDWIAILHNKAKGLAAYDTYMADARDRNSDECIQMLERLRDEDERQVREIREHVAGMMNQDSVSGASTGTSRSQGEMTGRAAFEESQVSH